MKAARIVVLAVALGAGGIAAMLAGRTEKPPEVQVVAPPPPETVDILVARADIPMGNTVSPGEIQWQAWPAGASTGNFIRKSDRPTAIEDLSGQIARVPFVAGEPIREAKLVNAKGSGFMAAILPTGMRAVSTLIRPETGAAGFILPNDRVDVILTRRDGDKASNGGLPPSETILSNVRVLAIDQNIEEKSGQKVMTGSTATLELTQPQAELLAQGQSQGQLSLSLRSVTDASQKPDATEDTRRGGVNIVRFGVGTVTTPR
ncbi:MAG: Flp pilus assembly protein CpaB [Pseudolabrys sp.]|nr:Flp pilus assembly protein CpaB [Pseudolabrys sp.]